MVLCFSCSSTTCGGSISAALAPAFQVCCVRSCIILIFCSFADHTRAVGVAFHSWGGRVGLRANRASVYDTLTNDEASENGGCKQKYKVERDDYFIETIG